MQSPCPPLPCRGRSLPFFHAPCHFYTELPYYSSLTLFFLSPFLCRCRARPCRAVLVPRLFSCCVTLPLSFFPSYCAAPLLPVLCRAVYICPRSLALPLVIPLALIDVLIPVLACVLACLTLVLPRVFSPLSLPLLDFPRL